MPVGWASSVPLHQVDESDPLELGCTPGAHDTFELHDLGCEAGSNPGAQLPWTPVRGTTGSCVMVRGLYLAFLEEPAANLGVR